MSKDSSLHYLERIIRHMTGKLREGHIPPAEHKGSPWWVLVCGEPFDPESLEQRDRVRNRLRQDVEAAGIALTTFEWVWDDTNQAQLVVGRHQEKTLARVQADKLRSQGFTARVVPAMPEASSSKTEG